MSAWCSVSHDQKSQFREACLELKVWIIAIAIGSAYSVSAKVVSTRASGFEERHALDESRVSSEQLLLVFGRQDA